MLCIAVAIAAGRGISGGSTIQEGLREGGKLQGSNFCVVRQRMRGSGTARIPAYQHVSPRNEVCCCARDKLRD